MSDLHLYATSESEVVAALGCAHHDVALADALVSRASEFARTDTPLREIMAGELSQPRTWLAIEALIAAASWTDAMPAGINVAEDLDDLFGADEFKPRLLTHALPITVPNTQPQPYCRVLRSTDAALVARTWLARETDEPAEFTSFCREYLELPERAAAMGRTTPDIILISPSFSLQRQREPQSAWPPKIHARHVSDGFLVDVDRFIEQLPR
ncbi:MAG: hypothetical protein ACRCWS_07215 [Propionibacteriaceae bacterium]